MQNYTKYTFDSTNEILVAQLFALGFDSFQELEGTSEGYILDEMITDELNAEVKKIASTCQREPRLRSRGRRGRPLQRERTPMRWECWPLPRRVLSGSATM